MRNSCPRDASRLDRSSLEEIIPRHHACVSLRLRAGPRHPRMSARALRSTSCIIARSTSCIIATIENPLLTRTSPSLFLSGIAILAVWKYPSRRLDITPRPDKLRHDSFRALTAVRKKKDSFSSQTELCGSSTSPLNSNMLDSF